MIPAKSTSIKTLPERIIALDRNAFIEFSKIYGPRFFTYLRTCGLSVTDAQDLAISSVTDILLKIPNKYNPIDGKDFNSWIFKVLRNILMDWRKKQKIQIDEFADPDYFIDEEKLEDSVPQIAALHEAIEKLPPNDRDIIRLHDFDGLYTFVELSKKLHVAPNTARIRYFRAKQRLQKILLTDQRIISFLQNRGYSLKG